MNSSSHVQQSLSYRHAALIAGVFSLLMFAAAMVAEFSSRQSLIVPGDADITAQNILTHSFTFRLGLFGFVLILVCDVLVAWALYHFLEPVHKQLSLLAAWFRLVYTAMFGMALSGLVNGFRLLNSGLHTDVPQRAMEHFQSFDDGWAIAQVFFGFHLLLMGYLILRSGFIPKILGVLLLMASVAYLADNLARLLLTDYAYYKTALTICVALPSMIGELGLAIWLLMKGGKKK